MGFIMNNIPNSRDLPSLLTSLPPEIQLLICCARVQPVEPFHSHINILIANRIEWENLFALAAQHGLVAFLHKHLKEIERESVPATFLTQLNQHHKVLRIHQLFLTTCTLKISQLLNDANVLHFHYKGIVLDHLLYGGQMLRPAGDMDILVKQEDVMMIRDLLMAEGYRSMNIEHERQETIALKQYKDYVFVHPHHGHIIEVHWLLMPKEFGNNFDFAYFEKNQQTIYVNQQPLATFGREDLFLPLACHGTRHQFDSLKWLVDLNQFISYYPETDWSATELRAKRENIETMYLLSVDLCRQLLGAKFARYGESVSHSQRIEVLSEDVCQTLCNSQNQTQSFNRIIFRVRLIDGFIAKIRYILLMTFQIDVKDITSAKLPWYSMPYYYTLRGVRLIRRQGIGTLLQTLGRMLRAIRE